MSFKAPMWLIEVPYHNIASVRVDNLDVSRSTRNRHNPNIPLCGLNVKQRIQETQSQEHVLLLQSRSVADFVHCMYLLSAPCGCLPQPLPLHQHQGRLSSERQLLVSHLPFPPRHCRRLLADLCISVNKCTKQLWINCRQIYKIDGG